MIIRKVTFNMRLFKSSIIINANYRAIIKYNRLTVEARFYIKGSTKL